MLTLRLTQSASADGQQRVEAALEKDGVPRQTAVATFRFAVSADDRERVRWYLEDYLEYPLEPAPAFADEAARRLRELGIELFRGVFQSSDDARDLWATLRANLDETRIEVLTDVADATSIPWELLRDPKTDVALALRARAFVRAQHQTAQPIRMPVDVEGGLRVLLVICRPAGERDVPFRSVASHLVRLSSEARDAFDLDVLRPPSFAQLDQLLHAAKAAGRPYHVVHFDGHGAYLDVDAGGAVSGADTLGEARPLRYSLLSPPRPGAHGYLLFEDPTTGANQQLVDGPAIGNLLAETGVPVLVLNACRSAHAEVLTAPARDDPSVLDVHHRVRAYGSLAQEVVDAGVPGVVAMRYNVWVVTAAQFIGDLYAAVLLGGELGAAVTRGRKQLAAQPNRAVAFDPLPLQDWMVPVVYEAAPLSLTAPAKRTDSLEIRLDRLAAAAEREQLGTRPPSAPDVGFYGRDETLLALDRSFDRDRVVLLHAYAGSGKTTTAAEFARWYQHTGGLATASGGDGLVLFTSFEHYRPLARVIDDVGEAFSAELEAAGVAWYALTDIQQRRSVALQVLAQIPVLWIWDNVEPITGFPVGSTTPWSPDEQRELLDLLRAVRETTRAKVLLTSRRPERGWLGELPVRVALPPMPMADSVQLARAIVERHPPHQLSDVEDWRPLLRVAAGNPLTITVLVGQALRENVTTFDDINAFVARLREGAAELADDEAEGRSSSLAASLGYGLASAFDDTERAQLAVLHLFQGFVDVDALGAMSHVEEGGVAELAPLTRDDAIALLGRAAEIGLLIDYGRGYYGIHPALPWYFRTLFAQSYGPLSEPRGHAVVRAYAHAVGQLGAYWASQEGRGRGSDITVLKAEEANLLHARRIARANAWWEPAVTCMAGLRTLYSRTGRSGEWRRLVDEMTPDFVDPQTGGPLPGREKEWETHISFLAANARDMRDWAEGERLARKLVDISRARAADALAREGELTDDDRGAMHDLGRTLAELGNLLLQNHQPESLTHFEEAISLFERLGAKPEQANTALGAGHAHLFVPELRDLDAAERWYRHGMSLLADDDNLGHAIYLDSIGSVDRRRVEEAIRRDEPESVVRKHVEAAVDAYERALELMPKDAVGRLAVTHDQLAKLLEAVGNVQGAVSEYLESVRYEEMQGNYYGAAQSRSSIARVLAGDGRLGDALKYAEAAEADLMRYPEGSVPMLEEVRSFIAALKAAAEAARHQ